MYLDQALKHSDLPEVDPDPNTEYDDIEKDNIDESDNSHYDEIEIPKDNDLLPPSILPAESEDFQGNNEYDEIEIPEDISNDDEEDDDDFENSNYVEDEDNNNDDDLYALFSIPGFGVISAIFLVIWKKYRDRFILGVLNRIINGLTNDDDQISINTTSTSVDTTLVKTRMSDPILSSSSSSFPISSITTPTGSEIWNDRIYTNAQRIYKHVKKDRSSDNLSDRIYVDVQTQVSFDSSSDYN